MNWHCSLFLWPWDVLRLFFHQEYYFLEVIINTRHRKYSICFSNSTRHLISMTRKSMSSYCRIQKDWIWQSILENFTPEWFRMSVTCPQLSNEHIEEFLFQLFFLSSYFTNGKSWRNYIDVWFIVLPSFLIEFIEGEYLTCYVFLVDYRTLQIGFLSIIMRKCEFSRIGTSFSIGWCSTILSRKNHVHDFNWQSTWPFLFFCVACLSMHEFIFSFSCIHSRKYIHCVSSRMKEEC